LEAPPAAIAPARGAAYNGNNVMARIGIAALLFLLTGTGASQAQQTRQEQDTRQFVHLAAPMQEHMLSNMRDHLATLNEIIGDVANGKYDAAAKIAEARLGMSSLSLHGAAHLAPYLPKPMQDIGTSMHHAASRLVIVLQNAAVTPTADAMRDINRALYAVTTACEACHAGYRVR
jgi:hypothetical protein